MNSIVNHMGKYDHRQHVLSDWLTELEQRFQLGDVETDKGKITWCQLLIGAAGSSILAGLEDDASWEVAKETLLSRLGVGSVRDEAWAALKELKQVSKEIVGLAGEAEKLAKRLHPRDVEAAGIIPGTAGSPQIRATIPLVFFRTLTPPGISPPAEGERSPSTPPVPLSISVE